jgi:putative two-component system response regulator
MTPRMATPPSSTESSEASDRRTRARIDPVKQAHHDAVFTLARASEAHDEDTGAHVLRIRFVVEQIAIAMGLGADDARELGYDAMLHDVGKLRIAPEILKKPGQLTDAERIVMESHTIRGERLLGDRPSFQRAARIARSHHENWDGSGYPDHLRSDSIPLEARITAAADVLDALVSERVYKQSWTYEQAMREVIGMAGRKLDPAVVEALRRCNAAATLCSIFDVPPQCVE